MNDLCNKKARVGIFLTLCDISKGEEFQKIDRISQ